jgi:hypothetical protein
VALRFEGETEAQEGDYVTRPAGDDYTIGRWS